MSGISPISSSGGMPSGVSIPGQTPPGKSSGLDKSSSSV